MTPLSLQNVPGFELVFNALPGNYLILATDPPVFTIVAVSNAYAHVTMTVREQMVNKGLFEIFPDNPDDPEATGVANLSASLNLVIDLKLPHKMALQKYDIPLPDGNGFEERYWSPLNTPVPDENGNIVYIIHCVEDVTEKIKTAAALKSQTEMLKRTNAELEQFVTVSSHDLQEPLRKIRTYAGMIQSGMDGNIQNPAAQHVKKISITAERMSNRLKALLRYAYLLNEQGFSLVNLNEVYKDVCDDLELIIAEKNAVLVADHLPIIAGIRHQLHQLFHNLLYNALQFSGSAPPRISITVNENVNMTHSVHTHTTYHEIVITDNGIGFEQQHAERIFTVFERLQTSDGVKGTGMGLSICKKVVHNHSGRIFAEGEPGKGAKFHVMLPVQ